MQNSRSIYNSKYDIGSILGWDIKLQFAKSDTDNIENPSLTESPMTIRFIYESYSLAVLIVIGA